MRGLVGGSTPSARRKSHPVKGGKKENYGALPERAICFGSVV